MTLKVPFQLLMPLSDYKRNAKPAANTPMTPDAKFAEFATAALPELVGDAAEAEAELEELELPEEDRALPEELLEDWDDWAG